MELKMLLAFVLFVGGLCLLLYFLVGAALKKMSSEERQLIEFMSEMNKSKMLLDLKLEELKRQNEADLKLINPTSELLNSTQREQYEAYLKRGGTDNEATWLQKSELHELFP
jgi:hypothetical protein